MTATAIALLLGLTGAARLQGSDGVTKIPLLPPGPGNPRNSEGGLLELKDGSVLLVYTKFTRGSNDDSPAELAERLSGDGGRTWSLKDTPVLENEGRQNVMSVSLLRLGEDEIGLFYLRKDSKSECRMYLRRSPDEGRTWTGPVLCMPEPGYYVVNNDRVVRLKGGRLVIPAARHATPDHPWTERGTALCFLSDDAGRTWRQGKGSIEGPPEGQSGLQEPLVVERRDGRLLMLCRTDLGCQYRSFSSDGGETWSKPEATSILSPLSPASVARIPRTGDLLLVWNNHAGVDDLHKGKRTPFSVALSTDDGETWGKAKTLDDDPDGWYCYTAIAFVGDRVILAHCAGDSKVGRLNRMRITTFDVAWLYR